MSPTAWSRAALGLLLAGSALLCSCSSKRSAGQLTSLAAPSWRAELPVAGFGPAVVALPLGARTPRPIALVIHGAADHPDWQCGSFRGLLGSRGFVVCPRGNPHPTMSDRYTLGNVAETSAELKAALGALKARFGGHVASGPVLLIGYAEGAAMAAELLREEPKFFARVALINGNPNALSSSAASIFGKGGGKRVLFFCTDSDCQSRAELRATWLTRAGATSKAIAREVGPWLDLRFTDALSSEMIWLLDGDARWQMSSR